VCKSPWRRMDSDGEDSQDEISDAAEEMVDLIEDSSEDEAPTPAATPAGSGRRAAAPARRPTGKPEHHVLNVVLFCACWKISPSCERQDLLACSSISTSGSRQPASRPLPCPTLENGEIQTQRHSLQPLQARRPGASGRRRRSRLARAPLQLAAAAAAAPWTPPSSTTATRRTPRPRAASQGCGAWRTHF